MLRDSPFRSPAPAVVIVGAVGKWATAITWAVVHLSTARPGSGARTSQVDIFPKQLADIIAEQ